MWRDLHVWFAWLVIASNALAGLWCAAAYRWLPLRRSIVWVAVAIAQMSALAQAVIGAGWSRTAGVELDDMHALYGFTAVAAVGVLYSYRNSGFLRGKELLLYAGGSLFIMGLGLRNLYL